MASTQAVQVNQYGRVSEAELRAGDLLSGPRGRELCARLAGLAQPRDGVLLVQVPGPAGASPPAAAEPPVQDDEEQRQPLPPDRDDPLAVIPMLAEVAEDAGYWGGAPATDPLGHPDVIAELHPVAARLAGSAGCRWWWSGIDRGAQRYVQWTARQSPPELASAAKMLRDADAEADEDERRMSSYRNLPAGSGVHGPWWTRPSVLSTSRRLGRLGAVLLAGQEDGFGDTDAVVWPLTAAGAARVLEVDGPQAWQRLIAAYPRPATATYRHTWAWTGWDGEWLVPRWPAVARDWDGVHLSVAGYLSTAGRALPVGTARTLLAGWNPDETYWLTNVLTHVSPPRPWHNPDRTPLGWQEATATA
jgi:hypothetical protein